MPAFSRSSSGSSTPSRSVAAARLPRRGGGRLRHQIFDDRDRGQAQHAGQREQALQANRAVEQGRADKRQREHEADHRADHRHDLGPVLLAREVGRERHRDRGDRAGALQRARGDRGPDVVGGDAEEAAGGEHQQPDVKHALAAPPVGRHAEGNLQDALRQAVNAERDANQP